MLLKDELKWKGTIDFSVFDEETVRAAGLIDKPALLLELVKTNQLSAKNQVHVKNKVTNYARQAVAQVISGVPTYLPNSMELGTGSGTTSALDTDLWNPSVGTLKPLSSLQPYLNYYAQYVCTWLTSDPIQGTWTEIGLKDVNNNLWAHAIITGLPAIQPGEMLVAQWQVAILGN